VVVLRELFAYLGALYVMLWPQDVGRSRFSSSLSPEDIFLLRASFPHPKPAKSPLMRLLFAGLPFWHHHLRAHRLQTCSCRLAGRTCDSRRLGPVFIEAPPSFRGVRLSGGPILHGLWLAARCRLLSVPRVLSL